MTYIQYATSYLLTTLAILLPPLATAVADDAVETAVPPSPRFTPVPTIPQPSADKKIKIGVLGGFLFGLLGITAGGLIGALITATVGAVVLIALLRLVKRA